MRGEAYRVTQPNGAQAVQPWACGPGCPPWQFNVLSWGLPWWLSGQVSACSVGAAGSVPGLGRSPGEGNGLPTPVFSPGESHAQRRLVGYSLRGCRESDTTLTHRQSLTHPPGGWRENRRLPFCPSFSGVKAAGQADQVPGQLSRFLTVHPSPFIPLSWSLVTNTSSHEVREERPEALGPVAGLWLVHESRHLISSLGSPFPRGLVCAVWRWVQN